MIISYNQLAATGTKVFEGLGYAPGDREDAAECIAWRARLGLPSLELVVPHLARLKNPSYHPLQRIEDPDSVRWDADMRSALLVGAWAIEWVSAVLQSGFVDTLHFEINRIQDGIFLWGLFSKLENRPSFEIECGETIAQFEAENRFPTVYKRHTPLASGRILGRAANSQLTAPPHAASAATFTPTHFESRLAYQIHNGIEIDSDLWSAYGSAARAVLVPSSKRSREQGAGE